MSNTVVEICSVVIIVDGVVEDAHSFADVKKAEEKFIDVLRGYGNFTDEEEEFYLEDGYYIGENFAICLTHTFIEKDELEKKMGDAEKEKADTAHVMELMTGVNNDCERRDD